MKYPKRSQYKYAKSRYRVGNWPEYEAGLRRRGDLTVWFSEGAINSWREPPSGKPGGQRRYADIAIEAALTILIAESSRVPGAAGISSRFESGRNGERKDVRPGRPATPTAVKS